MNVDITPPDVQRFPAGTTLKIYARDAFPAIPDVPAGEPPKGKHATAKVGKTLVVGLDLEPDVAYVAYANVDDEHRYFLIAAAPQS